jgi:hypothetical protein
MSAKCLDGALKVAAADGIVLTAFLCMATCPTVDKANPFADAIAEVVRRTTVDIRARSSD